jgi:hypothetical protein
MPDDAGVERGEDDENLMLGSIFRVSFVSDPRTIASSQPLLKNPPARHRPNRRLQLTSEVS